jgi:hypothetical protein
MKLISCTDFVLEQEKKGMQNTDRPLRFERILKYAKFLKQPLTLSMFVPTDDDGNVLEEPKCMYIYNTQCFECTADEMYRCRKYNEAKERVIFEGFELDNTPSLKIIRGIYITGFLPKFLENKTVEDLIKHNLTITPNAVKTYQL